MMLAEYKVGIQTSCKWVFECRKSVFDRYVSFFLNFNASFFRAVTLRFADYTFARQILRSHHKNGVKSDEWIAVKSLYSELAHGASCSEC